MTRRTKIADRSFSFLFYDIKNAVKKNWLKILPAFIVCIVLCMGVNREADFLCEKGEMASASGFWDYIIYAYAGMEEYFPVAGSTFEIPVYWFLLTLYIPYLAGSYAYDELHSSVGIQALIRMRKRESWFWGKVLYCVTCVICFYLAVWSVFFIFSWFGTGSISSSGEVSLALTGIDTGKMPSLCYFYASLILLPMLLSVFLALFQVVISIVSKPVWGYLMIVVYVIASVYWRMPFLIADCTMLLRNKSQIPRGTDSYLIIAVLVIFIILEIAVGNMLFWKKDLLKKEEEGGLWK